MKKNWNDYKIEETLLINKSYYYFLECYFREKGFNSKSRTFIFKKDSNIRIGIDVFHCSMKIVFCILQDKTVKDIWLHRYVLYPDVIDSGPVIKIPTPDWGYGFIEQMIHTLEKSLLEDLINRNIIFSKVLEDHISFYQDFISKPSFTHTEETIWIEDNKMLQIPFKSTYLSLKMYMNKENPFKGKVRSVRKLENPEVSEN
jgi:hypothetical protein